jgi:hypothetical protein
MAIYFHRIFRGVSMRSFHDHDQNFIYNCFIPNISIQRIYRLFFRPANIICFYIRQYILISRIYMISIRLLPFLLLFRSQPAAYVPQVCRQSLPRGPRSDGLRVIVYHKPFIMAK